MLKKLYFLPLLLAVTFMGLQAQVTSTFEAITLPQIDSFLNGQDLLGGYTDGNAFFPSNWNPDWGGYWSGGWAITNVKDSTTIGVDALYAGRAGGGANGSTNYAIGQQGAMINFLENSIGANPIGLWVTNSTYAANSMATGDMFAKKFGGDDGNDPDFFLLTIKAWQGGIEKSETIEFYLADYRFEDNSQDYIITDWNYINLEPLGATDSLAFELTSSDVGDYGINTPLFFAMDDLELDVISSVSPPPTAKKLTFSPNPAHDIVEIRGNFEPTDRLTVLNSQGAMVLMQNFQPRLAVDGLPAGLYWIRIEKADNQIFWGKLVVK